MKRNLRDWQKVCVIALAVIMLASLVLTPVAMAKNTAEQGGIDGEKDGRESTSSGGWMAVGFFSGGLSWFYPEIWELSFVPKSPVLGKSPEYAAAYSDAYLQARKKVIQKNSLIGGCIYWGACVGTYAACCLLSAASTADSEY